MKVVRHIRLPCDNVTTLIGRVTIFCCLVGVHVDCLNNANTIFSRLFSQNNENQPITSKNDTMIMPRFGQSEHDRAIGM